MPFSTWLRSLRTSSPRKNSPQSRSGLRNKPRRRGGQYRELRRRLAMLETLEERHLLAALVWTGDGGDLNWNNPANWSANELPGSGDDVTISGFSDITISHASAATSINSLTSDASLALSGGSFSIAAHSIIDANLLLSGGTLTGAGDLTVTATFEWTGGTQTGSGRTVLAEGAQMLITGTGVKTAAGRPIDSTADGAAVNWTQGTISGTLQHSGSLNISGDADKFMSTGAVINQTGTTIWTGSGDVVMFNNATFNNQAGSLFEARNDQQFRRSGTSTGMQFRNFGTFRKLESEGVTQFGAFVAFHNSGTLDIQSGTIRLAGGGTLQEDSSVTGPGVLELVSSTSVTGTATVENLALVSGTLSGDGDLIVGNTFDWLGGTHSGVGQTILQPSAQLNLTGTGTKSSNERPIDSTADGAAVNWTQGTIAGTLQHTGNLNISGDLNRTLSTGAVINQTGTTIWTGSGDVVMFNNATFNNQAGSLFEARNDQQFRRSGTSTGTQFRNFGTFRKLESEGVTQFGAFVAFHNSGTLDIQSGTIRLAGGGTLQEESSVTGPGVLELASSTSVTGTATVENLALVSGTLSGDGDLIIGNTFDWIGGTHTGVGQTILQPGAQLNLTGTGAKSSGGRPIDSTADGAAVNWTQGTIAGTLQHTGNLNISGDLNRTLSTGAVINQTGTTIWSGSGNVVMFSNATFNNQAGSVFEARNDQQFLRSGSSTGMQFRNFGTFRKLESEGVTQFGTSVSFHNSGTLDIQSGTIRLAGGGTLQEDSSVTGPGVLELVSSTSVTGTATVENLALVSGTLSGDGDLIIGNTFDWLGGTQSGVGQTILQPGAQLNLTGTGTKSSNGRPINSTADGAAVNWTQGTIAGTLQHTGNLNISGDLNRTLTIGAVFNQTGTTIWSGSGNVVMFSNATFNNQAGSVFEAWNDQQFLRSGSTTGMQFRNYGTFRKLESDGVTQFGTAVTFDNQGTVEIHEGTLQLSGSFPQFSSQDSALTGGVYLIAGTFQFPNANIINNHASITLDGPSSRIINQSTQDALADFSDNSGTFTLGEDRELVIPGPFANSGLMSIGAGSTLRLLPESEYTQTEGSTTLQATTAVLQADLVDIQGGTLKGVGTVQGDVFNAGDVMPGTSIGTLSVQGDYTQSADGTLSIQLAGTEPNSQFDRLDVTGTATLGGTLDVALLAPFVPEPGDSFAIMSFANRQQDFETYDGLSITQTRFLYPQLGDENLVLQTYQAGVTIAPLEGLTTSEDADSDEFTVVLDAPPTTDVLVSVESSDTSEGTVSTSLLVFTPENWDVPRTVVVTGVDDDLLDGDVAYEILLGPAVSDDARYDGMSLPSVSVVNLDNDVPTIDVEDAPDQVADEGSPVSVTFLFTSNLEGHAATIDWGDGTVIDVLPEDLVDPVDGQFGQVHGSHVFADDGEFAVVVTVVSQLHPEAQDTGTLTFTVNNVAPVLEPLELSDTTIDEGESITLTGSFTDPGLLDTHTVTINWGDGTDASVIELTDGERNFEATHTYLEPGPEPDFVFSILVTVEDKDGGLASRSTEVVVNPLADPAEPFVVTTTADSGPGSLRQAILDANAADEAVTITFAIAENDPGFVTETFVIGDGDDEQYSVFVIQPESALPAINNPNFGITIDGRTQRDHTGDTNPFGPVIVLDGSLLDPAISGQDGLKVQSDNNQILSLNIREFSGNGIEIDGSFNWVTGNFIGTDATGTTALGNAEDGVHIRPGSTGNVVGGTSSSERNVISGNAGDGVELWGLETSGNVVLGNYIGTDATGLANLGNGQSGVRVASDANDNLIGGTEDGAGNVISGNGLHGIYIIRAGSGNQIRGNLIGTDATGNAPLGNMGSGIGIDFSPESIIGGNVPTARNVISGNQANGIQIWGEDSTGNWVAGNFIGTDVTGTAALGNGIHGVTISDGASSNLIGTEGEEGFGNFIAFNGGDGVRVTEVDTTGNTLRGNSIHSNAGLGIDLGGDGVTPNDLLDEDSGPNNLQNFPEITFALSGSATHLSGTLHSRPDSSFAVDFYANSGPDSSGHGQGQRWLGWAEVTTDSHGNASFDVDLDAATTHGEWVTATATAADGSTSEFSAAILLVDETDPPPVEGVVVVTTLDDLVDPFDGLWSLREAIIEANDNPEVDTILFDASLTGGTIVLGGTQLPTIASDVTIIGLGADHLTIDADGNSRLFEIAATTTVEISSLALTGGSAFSGGAILNDGMLTVTATFISGNRATFNAGALQNSGELTLTGTTLSGNSAGFDGGGIVNTGTLTLLNSGVSGNTATEGFGGGIWNNGTLTASGSTISENSADRSGGGITNASTGTIVVAASTISDNSAGEGGGGVNNFGGSVELTDSMLSGNSADTHGGGLFNTGNLTITGSTISDNQAVHGGGIQNSGGGQVSIADSMIVGNTADTGGGIRNFATLVINNTIVAENQAGQAGGIRNSGSGSEVTILGSTISDNQSTSQGGGVLNAAGGTITIDSSSISGNTADASGGGIYNEASESLVTINNSTIVLNHTATSGGGINNAGGSTTLNNTTVAGNTAASNGGGIRNSGNLTVAESTLTNNSAEDGVGGGIWNTSDGTVEISGSTLSGNFASLDGGAIRDSGAVTITETTLTDNSAGRHGGAIHNISGALTVTDSTLTGNSAGASGGAIDTANTDTLATISGSEISNNTAGTTGGGIQNWFATLTLADSTVADNSAGTVGGGIWNSGAFTANSSNITSNSANNGGAIWNDSSGELSVADSDVSENSAGNQGGAFRNAGNLLVIGSTIRANTAGGVFGGAGILNTGSATIQESTIQANVAQGSGGGIYSIGALSIENSDIRENSAQERGGGIDNRGSLTVSHTTVKGNTAQGSAGGIGNDGTAEVTSSVISNNSSGAAGGGVNNTSADALLTMIGSTVNDNVSNTGGGGISNFLGTVTLTNTTISGNSSRHGGGGIHSSGTLTLNHGTIALNRADSDSTNSGTGGGIHTHVDAVTTLHSTIVAGNMRGAEGDDQHDDLIGTVEPDSRFNLIGNADSTGGLVHQENGNIVGLHGSGTLPIDTILNTTLADNGGPTLTHALVPGSRAIDAGDPAFDPNLFDPPLTHDQRGEGFDRVKGGRIDIGAFEGEAQPFFVTTTADSGPGSLRQAILDANAAEQAVTITFAIAESDPGFVSETLVMGEGDEEQYSVFVIQPETALPAIDNPDFGITIDGRTQRDHTGDTNPFGPVIVLDGGLLDPAISGQDGLKLQSDNNQILSLNIRAFPGNGIEIDGSFNWVTGNFIGTDATGTTALGNAEDGVHIRPGSTGNVVGGTSSSERNVISGNAGDGVELWGLETSGNVVLGNYIGTDATGLADLGNGQSGVRVASDANDNLIGGTEDGAGNVISGNGLHGIYIIRAGSGNQIRGNLIGTDATGNAPLGNMGSGVGIDFSPESIIGGNVPGARNVISGNQANGVQIWGEDSTGNWVAGNYIGTDVTGTAALGNGIHGVVLSAGASNNLVGTDGDDAALSNLIAFNLGDGVRVVGEATTGNTIRYNSIHSNAGLGIDLGGDGVTPNDPLDQDIGPNNLQNFPEIATAIPGEQTLISGTLHGKPDETFTLDFYANLIPHASQHGEGRYWIGSTTVATNSAGDATFLVTFDMATSHGQWLTATATASDGSTSEFSRAVIANRPPVADDVQLEAVVHQPAVVGLLQADDPDEDDDSDSLHYVILSQPAEGTLTHDDGGRQFTFDPGTDFWDLADGETRDVTFTYQAIDQHGAASNVATVTITVFGVDATQVVGIHPVSPDPRNTPVPSLEIEFSHPIDVGSFTNDAVTVMLNGQPQFLFDEVTLTPISEWVYQLGGLELVTGADGVYEVNLDGSAIADVHGRPVEGALSTSWLMDTVPPISKVDPLPAVASSLTFPVSVTQIGFDPAPPGIPASGVQSYDLYVRPSGGTYQYWTTVPADSPVAMFTAESNLSYAFYSVARDVAGNVENKSPTLEAGIYVPDFDPPETQIDAVNAESSTFVIEFSGTDTGGSGLQTFELYVMINGGAAHKLAAIPAGPADGNGVHRGTVAYQAIADGEEHVYEFFTVGIDGRGNIEQPTEAFEVTATFDTPEQLEVVSFVVQQGMTQRSYIRYLDITFNLADELPAIVDSLGDADTTTDRLRLRHLDYEGNLVGMMLDVSMLTITGHMITIDFGEQGIGGDRNSNVGDGFYELAFDLDGNGKFDTSQHFHRLLGDLTGNREVNQNDLDLVIAGWSSGTNPPEADTNGNGNVATDDVFRVWGAVGRKLEDDLLLAFLDAENDEDEDEDD
jgi:hypothetical protein